MINQTNSLNNNINNNINHNINNNNNQNLNYYKNCNNNINNYNNYEKINCMNTLNNIHKLNKNSLEINNNIEGHESFLINKKGEDEKMPCGIINHGNNCYLNCGLQILATCDKFIKELKKYQNIKTGFIHLINDEFFKILNEEIYDPKNILHYFCKINNESFNSQYCSQNFIRTLLKNINNELINKGEQYIIKENCDYRSENKIEYDKYLNFIKNNKIFPESIVLNLFSGISKSHTSGFCPNCNEYIEDYCFSYFIDQNIYLDNVNSKCDFISVLFDNIGSYNNLTMNCPKCNVEITIKEEIKIIKLPEILIFTLERYKDKINNFVIESNEEIDMKKFLDKSVHLSNTKYELFAINIRFGKSTDFGHEICQVKRNNQWYEINDTQVKKRTCLYDDNSYGLFYKRL